MSAEGRPQEVVPGIGKATQEYPFDELARGLASGELSRGKALKLMGAALLGGALGFFSLPTKQAEAGRGRRIRYHNGPVMLGGINVYFIWYGDWSNDQAPLLLEEFAINLGGSAYFNINTLYRDASGARPLNSIFYGGAIGDDYSRGREMVDADVQAIVLNAIEAGHLPQDPRAIYVVLGASDVTVSDASTALCRDYCGFHDFFNFDNMTMKFAFVGGPSRCPSKCAAQTVGPNGTLNADAMASIMANLLSTTVTNPEGTGWYDKRGRENADKCAGKFGATYTVENGAKANMRLGSHDYLIQQNWVNKGRGYCALSYP